MMNIHEQLKKLEKTEQISKLIKKPSEVYKFISEQMELHDKYMEIFNNDPNSDLLDELSQAFDNDAIRKFWGEEFWQATAKVQYKYYLDNNTEVLCRAYSYYKDIFRMKIRCMIEENEYLPTSPLVSDRMKFLETDAAKIRWLTFLMDNGIDEKQFCYNFAMNVYYAYYSLSFGQVEKNAPTDEMLRNAEEQREIPSLDRIHYSNMIKNSVMEYINTDYIYNRNVSKGGIINLPWDMSCVQKEDTANRLPDDYNTTLDDVKESSYTVYADVREIAQELNISEEDAYALYKKLPDHVSVIMANKA